MRILLAHSAGLLLGGVRQALRDDANFEIVGEAHDADALMQLVEETRPDVVLLDVRMPGADGLECLRQVRTRYPATKVVISSDSAGRSLVQAAFRSGACGYIVESIGPVDLGPAIRQAVERDASYVLSLPEPKGTEAPVLSRRELEVVEAVARGLSNKAIASELAVTVQTVKFHLSSVYRKLGFSNRTEAARWVLGRSTDR
jgi:DNA-binding NarL/FixJ family response regulator